MRVVHALQLSPFEGPAAQVAAFTGLAVSSPYDMPALMASDGVLDVGGVLTVEQRRRLLWSGIPVELLVLDNPYKIVQESVVKGTALDVRSWTRIRVLCHQYLEAAAALFEAEQPPVLHPMNWDPRFIEPRLAEIDQHGLQVVNDSPDVLFVAGRSSWSNVLSMLVGWSHPALDRGGRLFALNTLDQASHPTLVHAAHALGMQDRLVCLGRHDVLGFCAEHKIGMVVTPTRTHRTVLEHELEYCGVRNMSVSIGGITR